MFVDDDLPVLGGKAEGRATAVALSVEHVLRHASGDFLGEIHGIVFGQAVEDGLKKDSFRAVGYRLRRGDQPHSVFLEEGFVFQGIVTATGEAVHLPNDDHVKAVTPGVVYHPLELWSVMRSRRDGLVNIVLDDGKALVPGESHALADLSLYGLLPLLVAGETSVDYGSILFLALSRPLLHSSPSFQRLPPLSPSVFSHTRIPRRAVWKDSSPSGPYRQHSRRNR